MAEPSPMPPYERFGLDDHDSVEDPWNPPIWLDEEQPITVREPHTATWLAPQHDQLMSQRRIFGFKSGLRLEWRGQDRQYEEEQR
jgi:hypothetical protein